MAAHKSGASSPHCQRQLAGNVTPFEWLLAWLLEGSLNQLRRRPVTSAEEVST
jgi:hypothetical protein